MHSCVVADYGDSFGRHLQTLFYGLVVRVDDLGSKVPNEVGAPDMHNDFSAVFLLLTFSKLTCGRNCFCMRSGSCCVECETRLAPMTCIVAHLLRPRILAVLILHALWELLPNRRPKSDDCICVRIERTVVQLQ